MSCKNLQLNNVILHVYKNPTNFERLLQKFDMYNRKVVVTFSHE